MKNEEKKRDVEDEQVTKEKEEMAKRVLGTLRCVRYE